MSQKISRRRLLASGSAAALGTTALATRTGVAEAHGPHHDKPNVLLIVLDDLGYGDLGCYGSPLVRTPRIDALARQGTRFTQAYSGAPVCTPSRAALLTGRVPARMGQHLMQALPRNAADGLPVEERTIAGYLREAGYRTAQVGKWHLGGLPEHRPTRYGFDRFFGLDAVFTESTYPFDLWRDGERVGAVRSDEELGALTGRLTDEAIAAIDGAGDQPFFVLLGEIVPHLPLAADPDFAGVSDAGTYGDTIEALDYHLGRLFTALRRRGLEDDTLVILASDNGPWFEGSVGRLRGRKFDVFEGGMRVPFIARWPKRIRSGAVSDATISLLDLLPTLTGLADVEPDPAIPLDGSDAWAALRGERLRERAPVPYHMPGVMELAALRDGPWKLHVRRRGSDQRYLPELYDLERDPSESYNLARLNAPVVARLQERIAAFDAAVVAEREGPVRVTALAAELPFAAGRTSAVTVTVARAADPANPGPVQVDATFETPAGWSAGSATASLAAGATVQLQVPVTAPAGPPAPGLVPALPAKVTAGTLRVGGTAVIGAFAVPDPAQAVLALDAGGPATPLLAGFRRLTPASTWDPAAGYGWTGAGPEFRDRGAPDALRRDMLTSTAPAVLTIAIPGGPHRVLLLRGDDGFATTGTQIEADGAIVVPSGPDVGVGEYYWDEVALDGGAEGRSVALRLTNTDGVYWKLLAVLVLRS